jgi:ubiquitin-protein ligase E3 C
MHHFFGGEAGKRRNINLGGSTAATHAAIVDQAKARRLERETFRRREENTLRIQAWYRGRLQAAMTKRELQRSFDENPLSLNATRYLALFGKSDNVRLSKWASSLLQEGDVLSEVLASLATYAGPTDSLPSVLSGSQSHSWQVLLQQISSLLLSALVDDPE